LELLADLAKQGLEAILRIVIWNAVIALGGNIGGRT